MLALGIAIMGVVVATAAAAGAIWQASLLRKQLARDDHVRRASFYQEIVKLILQIDYIFVENPAWRPCFYENQAPPDTKVEGQLLSLSEYIADIAESCSAAEEALPELLGDWDDYFNYLYRNSPVLRRYWADFGHLYPAGVVRKLLGPSARPKIWPKTPHKVVMLIWKYQTHPLVMRRIRSLTEPINQSLFNTDSSYLRPRCAIAKGKPPRTRVLHYRAQRMQSVSCLPSYCLGDITGMTVLDFGAGTGRTAQALLSHNAGHVIAVDKDANMLNVAERDPRVTYLRIGRSLPIAEQSMDARPLCERVS